MASSTQKQATEDELQLLPAKRVRSQSKPHEKETCAMGRQLKLVLQKSSIGSGSFGSGSFGM